MKRLLLALKAMWYALIAGEEGLKKLIAIEPPPSPEPEIPVQQPSISSDPFSAGVVYSLVLLQREGRLVDFLREDISGFRDDDIGAAVRQIHSDCKKVFDDNIRLSTIEEATEGESVDLTENFDPNRIKLTGNVPESPPYRGTLRHKGWQVTDLHLPTRSEKLNPMIIQPAELEIP